MGPLSPDDDALPNLPPMDGDDDSAPLEDTDSDDVSEDESVGLDASTAESLIDDSELVDSPENDDSSWLSDDSGENADDEDEDFGDEREENWAAFADVDEELEDDEELESGEGDASFVDAGEEGVSDEPRVSADDDAADLPALHENAAVGNEAADDLDLREAGELETAMLSFEDERRWMGAQLPEAWPKDRLRLEIVGDAADERPTVPSQEVTSFALDPRNAARLIVGTQLGGAFVSSDSGRSFRAANSWSRSDGAAATAAFYVAADVQHGSTRVWGRTERGAVYRSDDFGATWVGPVLLQPVMALCVNPTGGVAIVSVPKRGTAQLGLFRNDAWLMRNIPGPAVTREGRFVDVAAHGEVIAIAYDADPAGVYLSRDGGETFHAQPSLPSASHVALVAEDNEVTLYAALFFAGLDNTVVVRRATDGSEHVVFDAQAATTRTSSGADDDVDPGRRIQGLTAARRDGNTVLLIRTEGGVFRVILRT